MGMEYTGAIGTMVTNKLAEVNKCVSSAVDLLKIKSEELERDREDLNGQLEAEKERVWELEEQVVHREREHHLLHRETSSVKVVASECVLQMVELMTEVQALRLFQTALQHGLGNLIMVEDDKVVEETEEEEEEEEGFDFNANQVVFPDVGRFSPVLEMLVLIVDEDLRDAAQEVDRADEREELMRHRLTMDDQAWREVMETEQLLRVDLVPGYQAAPPLTFQVILIQILIR